jgi:hypothetical protein
LSYQIAPTYEQPLTKNGQTQSVWYRFFQGLYQGTPPSAESTLVVGASPWTYTAPVKGFVILKGGTVSAVTFTRSVTTVTGQTAGIFPMNQGDMLTVTYSGLPSMVWVPT